MKQKLVKWGPRTAKTRALWEAADRAWLLRDHPEDCPVCTSIRGAGLNSPDWIVQAHQEHQAHRAALAVQEREAAARRKAAGEAYYEGGFKVTFDGAPARYAAHVAKWKAGNRKMLGFGFDKYALTLRPHNKYGFTDEKTPARFLRQYVEYKELGEADGISPMMERSGYGYADGQLFRRTTSAWCGTISEHLSGQTPPHRDTNKHYHPCYWRVTPDLWTAARLERRRVAALTRHATPDYLPPAEETHAACGDSRLTAQRDCAIGRRESGHV